MVGGGVSAGEDGGFGPAIPRHVVYGLAIGTVGGPLALAAVLVPQTVAGVRSSSNLSVIVGSVAFALPLWIWCRYASQIASSGGLYGFVEAAAGKWVARLQGLTWIVSYFLYLPSTVAFVVYEVLPTAFPGIAPWRPALLVGLPVALVVGLVAGRLWLFRLSAAVALGQVVLVIVLGFVEIHHSGAPAGAFGLHTPFEPTAKASAAVGLFFVCASLPLYLGAEVKAATSVLPRALAVAAGVGAASAVLGALSLGVIPVAFETNAVPGFAIARAFSGQALADAVLLGVAASMLTLVLLEYVALTRLVPAMTGVTPKQAELTIGALFVASAALSLLSPEQAYTKLLKPSLIALYASEVVVVAVYPIWRRRLGKLRAADVVVAVLATALMGYGLYAAI